MFLRSAPRHGRPEGSVQGLDRAPPRLHRIGGSHAPRALFDEFRLAALRACGKWVEVQQILEQRRARDPHGVPLNRVLAQTLEGAQGLRPGQVALTRT